MINQNIYEKTDLVRVTYFVNIIFINNIKLQLGPYQIASNCNFTSGIKFFVAFLFLYRYSVLISTKSLVKEKQNKFLNHIWIDLAIYG